MIEFGAEQLRFIADAIKSNVPKPHTIAIDTANKEMCYAETSRSLEQITSALVGGAARSAIVRSTDPRIRYALITSPDVHAPPLALWMGTIEVGVENWSYLWEALLKQEGLRFVCVRAEEGVELGDRQISPQTFPWNAQGLLAGAVRTDIKSDWSFNPAR